MKESDVFPKWKYHKEKLAKIFLSEDEFNDAGDGWVDSPSEFDREELKDDSIAEDAKPNEALVEKELEGKSKGKVLKKKGK
jgi:hypothetical protein